MKKHDLALIIFSIGVIAVTIATIVLNGTPFDNQLKAIDQQKIEVFELYKSQVENYYSLERRLPETLAEAQIALSSTQPPLDPSVEYKIISSNQYRLCTTFKTEYKDPTTTFNKPVDTGYIKQDHLAGYDCLEYVIPNYIINARFL